MPHILILEDEAAIAESLSFVLQRESFTTHWQSLAANALNYVREQAVDLVIMDVGLPDISGFEACKLLREFSQVPVLFLTARSDEVDRVVGLEIGADDYVVKPFSPREVAARVKAILRRYAVVQPSAQMTPAQFSIDTAAMKVHYYGQTLNLTRIEYLLLQTLLSQPSRVFSRDQLLNTIGSSVNGAYDRSIDTHIKALRAKLRAVNAGVEPIKTERGFGYSYQPGLN
ncbi:two-component system response regulator CreB [Simiduia curdlanivorans]|uniref:Two-component system response regulator CreB n=1 Tax=Simiduia curdlanivorans TaxID=1492769 RepID=A0ABV8V5V1_9GAMM|nr:two-component system response regulator CreB [Simiduia curdlanivorans]MDN3638609.1 two-component system response regulator CreB [Simiduia curdlanivorans]